MHFKRDKAAAKIQESNRKKLVALAKRQSEYVSRPCFYCGTPMTLPTQETVNVLTNETQDHVVPRSKGGTFTVSCCSGCNRDKHHLSVNEWRCVLMFRRRRPVVFHFERIACENRVIFLSYLLSSLISC